MCLEVHDQYKCRHKGPRKGYEHCIWQMRAKRMPGVEQTNMTLEENISRCASATTERYDYPEDVCPACKSRNQSEEKEYQEKLKKQEEFRARERAKTMKRDYDRRQNMSLNQCRQDKTYADFEQSLKAATDKDTSALRDIAERQCRVQGLSQHIFSQLL